LSTAGINQIELWAAFAARQSKTLISAEYPSCITTAQ
jgi:hypothetical protein